MRWAAHLKGCVLTAALKGKYKPNSHTFLNTKPLLAVSGNQDIALSLSLGLSEKGKKNQCLCLRSCHCNGRSALRFHLWVRVWKLNFSDPPADIWHALPHLFMR